MSFFSDNYSEISYPIGDGGLRNAQIGAIHSIAGHFTVSNKPGIVVMPTGTGKTAVLMMSAFVLQARRVLVITPSRLVRNQIAKNFAQLQPLRRLGVIDVDASTLRVKEVLNKITTEEGWQALEEYDVIISTPQCVSPEIPDIHPAPDDFFDLVLIDEAHHSPAKTWTSILQHFENSRRILFTATPFRRDKKEVPGKIVFNYPISYAYNDGIFGQIEYIPVTGANADDITIARKAEEVLRAEPAGINHYLMVRTDSKKRAHELATIYQENTGLRLRLIHSGLSGRTIETAISDLQDRNIDGIICVDMLGEGFDFPNLKVAAIHSPHKSLATTLQFIGRFARTNANDIGTAKFIAIPQEIEIEKKALYNSNAIWQEMIIDLSEGRIGRELENREVIENFHVNEESTVEELRDLSIQSIEPYYHVKIYTVDSGEFNPKADIDLRAHNLEIVHRVDNDVNNATVLILKDASTPKWSKTKTLENVKYHLVVAYFDVDTSLLFINSTIKNSIDLYEDIASAFTNESDVELLSDTELNSVLANIQEQEFFNIGMRNRSSYGTNESYRIIAGQTAHNSIQKSDGSSYHRGHIFGKGIEEGNRTTIGLSSSSKVWRNYSSHLSEFIAWAKNLAYKINTFTDVKTNTPLDFLPISKGVSVLPNKEIICVDWNEKSYRGFATVLFQETRQELTDIELSIDRDNTNADQYVINVTGDGFNCPIIFSYTADKFFTPFDDELAAQIQVKVGAETVYSLVDYINNYPLTFFYDDFSVLTDYTAYLDPITISRPFENGQLDDSVNWTALGINIENECDGDDCIHRGINDHVINGTTFSYYDHGTREIADFITAQVNGDEILVRFYHCKGSASANPGNRVDDLYEVVNQGVKSLKYAEKNKLINKLTARQARPGLVQLPAYRYDTIQQLKNLFDANRALPVFFEIILVQPGFTKANINEDISTVLASASNYIQCSNACKKLRVITSA